MSGQPGRRGWKGGFWFLEQSSFRRSVPRTRDRHAHADNLQLTTCLEPLCSPLTANPEETPGANQNASKEREPEGGRLRNGRALDAAFHRVGVDADDFPSGQIVEFDLDSLEHDVIARGSGVGQDVQRRVIERRPKEGARRMDGIGIEGDRRGYSAAGACQPDSGDEGLRIVGDAARRGCGIVRPVRDIVEDGKVVGLAFSNIERPNGYVADRGRSAGGCEVHCAKRANAIEEAEFGQDDKIGGCRKGRIARRGIRGTGGQKCTSDNLQGGDGRIAQIVDGSGPGDGSEEDCDREDCDE